VKILVSIVNYLFIYEKKIVSRLKRSQDSLLNQSTSKQHYINYFKSLLRTSFLLDIASSVVSFWIFKGYQYYASQFSAAGNFELVRLNKLALLGNYQTPGSYFLLGGVMLWFCLECWKTYIQIFSVSSLTHLDNLKKESQRHQEEKFYSRHKKFALWWTVVFFFIGMVFLVPSFFTKRNGFQNYKLYYKYYSEQTISFWLSYTLIFILILTDRILAYDGFKKRQEFRARERRTTLTNKISVTNVNNELDNYQVSKSSHLFRNMEEALSKKFPDKSQEQIAELTDKVADIYNEKMRTHFYSLKEKMKENLQETTPIETSMSYVRFMRFFNVLNLIGYALILYSYQHIDKSDSIPSIFFYLAGFVIASIATFAFELTHNYLLYRSYFLQVLAKMNKKDE